MANNIRFYQENADKNKERVRIELSHKEKRGCVKMKCPQEVGR
jgi:hypothetical protein